MKIKYKRWTSSEVAFLKANYEKMFDKDLAIMLGRREDAVSSKRYALGLHRKTIPKRCKFCEKDFETQRRRGMFCSSKCRMAWYRLEWTRGQIQMNDKETIEIEKYALFEILPKHGFSDILWTRPYAASFPFDGFGDKNGKPCALEITEIAQRNYHKKLRPLISYLIKKFDLDIYILHIKKDKHYVLNKLNRGFWYSSALKWHPMNRQNRDYVKPFERIYSSETDGPRSI